MQFSFRRLNAEGLSNIKMNSKANITCQPVNSPDHLTGIFITLSVTGILTAAIGNSLIFLAVWKTKALRTSANYLLVSLSLASLMLIPVLASYTVSLTKSQCDSIMPYLCKWSSKIDFALFCVVMEHLVVISLDRLVAIKRPLRYVRKYSLQIGDSLQNRRCLACEHGQAPKWGVGRRQKSASPRSARRFFISSYTPTGSLFTG